MSALKKKKKEPKEEKSKEEKRKKTKKTKKNKKKIKKDKMKSSSKSKSAQRKPAKQKQRWGSFEDDMQKAILMSLEPVSEDLANKLASEEGDIAEQGRRLEHFERQKEQKEQRQKEQKEREQRQKEREAQRQREQKEKEKEKERERSREAHRSRERSKQARRENQEAERRIANKVREGLVDRAVALETIRDGRAAIEIAKLNKNLRAALQPGILGPFGVPKWPSSGHKWPKDDDDDDDDDDEEGAFAFNTACQALSATGECDSRAMQRYPPTKSVCWVHEAAPASVYGSMLSSIVEFWRKRPSEKHESKTKRLYQKVFQRYMDEGRTESPISIAAKVIGACIYVWGSVSGTTRWTVYHTETGECSLSSRAPVYLVMYATSTPGRYRYARIKPHTKGTTLPGSLVH
jgi:hypothetical protein